jgi:thiamine biosynthesis lipoprotein
MGSPFSIILYCPDSVKAKELSLKCFTLVDSLVAIYSDYIPDSELNRLSNSAGSNTTFKCSAALFDILKLSKKAFEESKGTFDITLGPLTHLWREHRKTKTFPDSSLVKKKLELTGFDKLKLDTANQSALMTLKGMQLDLGGIAQGYVAQKTINLLKSNGIDNALVDVSGDIVCIGTPPDKDGWTVAVSVPKNESELLSRQLIVSNCAVTTSGDIHQFIEHKGKRYSHLIDPSSGYGITSQQNVTVIANDGTAADWLTKACSILPKKEAMKLAKRLSAAFLIVESKKGKVVLHSSKNFKQFWKTSK